MNLLSKIENALNALLMLIGGLIATAFEKIIPAPIKKKLTWIYLKFQAFIAFIKAIPQKTLPWIKTQATKVKAKAQTFPLKSKIQTFYKASQEKYKGSKNSSAWAKYRTVLMTPIFLIGEWLNGLSATQSLLLLTFSAASVLSGVGMIFSGKRLVDHHSTGWREPASVEAEAEFERPAYYKKQTRHMDLTNLRLPVYIPEINEQKSVDVDFTATTSNRMAKKFLEKHEFQLRDHFILNIEPVKASFPIKEEGREIIRHKLLIEINQFLKDNGIDGYVTELKITYVLAN